MIPGGVARLKMPRRFREGTRFGWIAVLGSLFLTGCAPPDDEVVELAASATAAATVSGPRLTATHFIAADGAALPLRRWLPKAPVRAAILALHGFNDYGNAFEMPATLWAERGIATYAYDQRGFGGAPGRGLWAGSAALAGDAAAAVSVLRRLHPGRPVYLLGESMGGAVAIAAATGAAGTPPAEADGVILSAPALWGRPTMQLMPRLALWATVRLFPAITMSGQGLGIKPSDNEAMLRALGRDPMVIKETRVLTVYGLVNLMDLALEAAPRFSAPALLLYGAHDEVIPADPVRLFVSHLPPDPAHRRRLAYYPAGYHMLLRDLEGPVVAGDVAGWVLDPRAPLPSHADAAEATPDWPPRRPPGG